MIAKLRNFAGKFLVALSLASLFAATLMVSIGQSNVAHAYNTCVTTLTPVDKAPGDWHTEENKFLFASGTSTDVTDLYNRGLAYVSYSDQNYNILGGFRKGDWGIDPQSINQWGVRTRWTWFHQDFTSYHWLALWESSSAPC